MTREEAIKEIEDRVQITEYVNSTYVDSVDIEALRMAVSALQQPEIVRCKDCKYRDENWRRISVRWLPCMDMRTGSNWYCGSAERGEQDENR